MQNIDYKRLARQEAMANAQRAELPDVIEKAYLTATESGDIEDAARFARKIRDGLLKECDWTAVSDSPLNELQKIHWAAYRQELRDVPEQVGFPFAIEWPERPE